MIRPHLTLVFVVALSSGIVGNPAQVAARSPEPLCVEFDATSTAAPSASDPLAGRLGGSLESFIARFGTPIKEDNSSATFDLDGCGEFFGSFEEGIVTTVDFFSPGSGDPNGEASWSYSQALLIAARLLPVDAQQGEPFRNVSFVEHQPCYSDALATQVPMTVYSFVDANPTPGQCSASFEFNNAGGVLSIFVALQIADPS